MNAIIFQSILGLICILNPVMLISVYLNLTKEKTMTNKIMIALVFGVCTFVILAFISKVSLPFLDFFGFHLYAIQLGGGMLILIIGILSMLKQPVKKASPENEQIDKSIFAIGFNSLTLTFVAPVAILLTAFYTDALLKFDQGFEVYKVIVIVCIILVICLIVANYLSKVTIENLGLFISRLIGLILTAVAFEMFTVGGKAFIPILTGISL